MNIAVNTRFLLPGKMEGFGVYTHEIMRRITRQHSEDGFDFYFDRPFAPKFAYGDNVRLHRIGPPARHPFLYYVWYQYGLRRRLRKQPPDILFSPDAYMPLRLDTPVVLTIHDVAPMVFPQHINPWQRRYYQHFMPKFVRQASHIITVSNFSKEEILHYFDVDANKVSVVYNGVGEQFFKSPKNGERGENMKPDIPYFLYVGSIHPRKNLPTLLKAFDIFKARSGTDHQLVIAGRPAWKQDDVANTLRSMKYRSAVRMRGYIPDADLPSLVRRATAMVYISLYEGFGIPVVEAMAAGTPVITSNTGALAEIAGESALRVDPHSAEATAEGMQALLDEDRCKTLCAAGKERATKFTWDDSARRTYVILRDHALH